MKHGKTLVALTIALVALSGSPRSLTLAQTDDPSLSPAQEALALAVAQVCANEAFSHQADCLLVLQTVRSHGTTPGEQLAWLTQHSSRVLGPDEPVARRGRSLGNVPWTRHLTDSDERPAGWPTDPNWRWEPWTDSGGREHGGHVRTWRLTRSLTRAVIGRGFPTPRRGWPCSRDPETWGGRRTDADRIARLAHVYEALQCVDRATGRETLNEGFRYRPGAFRPATAE